MIETCEEAFSNLNLVPSSGLSQSNPLTSFSSKICGDISGVVGFLRRVEN